MERPQIKRPLTRCHCPSCQFFRSFVNDENRPFGTLGPISLEQCARKRMRLHAEDGPPISSSLGLEIAMRHALTDVE